MPKIRKNKKDRKQRSQKKRETVLKRIEELKGQGVQFTAGQIKMILPRAY